MPQREEVSPLNIKRVVTRYDSLRDIADEGERARRSNCASKTTNNNWYGTPTWEAARQLAEGGWSDGGRKLDIALDAIRPRVGNAITVNNRLMFQHTCNRPGVLDVGRYAADHPYMMVSPTFTATTPVVRIAVPAIWVNWMTEEDILNYGAVAAAVCEVLMSAGYGVEIVAVAGWRRNDGTYDVSEVVLKQSTEQLDVEDVAFGIAHPSMSRRFIFASGESRPHYDEIGCMKNRGYSGQSSDKHGGWSGTNPDITGGMGELDLTPMSAVFDSNGRTTRDSGIERGINIALAAIDKWLGRA